ncbi:MAG TPA: MaoC family dehydratase [Arenicellales bacterium]|jgi:acyl dehydratase|nr:MaoC family dehydratase [Pseudomonadales bacterium]HJL53459.1 MaoC family dehydratase [Arenicellales bacterium]|tara:strand:- start:2401 stop:2829 length:429 start_codon:yes stop_codon:yes gene_type:complete
MKISDISVGSEFPHFDIGIVDAEKMKTMAILIQDPNPIHWDVEAVRRLGLGDKPINQGPNNMAYVVNALVSWVGGIEKFRNLKVRFLGNVYAGDRLTVVGSVADIDEVKGDTLATCDVQLVRGNIGDEDVVMAGQASVILSG